MSGYILSVDADFDLDDIWEYIAADNLGAADRWIEKLFDAFEALGQAPGMGHRREDLTSHAVLSVSYTHLDVYKRQTEHTAFGEQLAHDPAPCGAQTQAQGNLSAAVAGAR